jgi:heterotetrameric sarcosine oxidase gamma subunit
VPELVARSALDGLGLPLTAGEATLSAAPDAPLCEILSLRGGGATGLPGPGRSAKLDDGSVAVWAGLDRWLARGAPAQLSARLGEAVAVVDQSDGWAGLTLTGTAARDVLARLLPLDLDPAAFPEGAAARSALRHVPCLVIATEEGFDLLVPRSYAASAVADLAEAMRSVAARAAL